MKYLFLDIEWNQINNQFNMSEDEVLEISAICADKDFQNERSFFRIVKPKHLEAVNNKTLAFLKLGVNVLEAALPIETVMDKFSKTFPKYEIIIVWNQYTYDLFLKAVKCSNMHLLKHQVVVLQEVLSAIDRSFVDLITVFENAMKRYHIDYNPNLLHCSKHDVGYLKKLYYLIKQQYNRQWEVEPIKDIYHTANSNVIHGAECYYIIGKDELQKAQELDIFEGYKMCKHCIEEGVFTVMPKTLLFGKLNGNKVFSEEKIAKICEGFHMEYKFANRIIFVNTQIAYWRIHHNGEKILNIFHENYRTSGSKSGKKKRKCNDGFHKQAVKFDDFFEALRYIYYHDKHFFVTGGKYSKLDKLFAKIETEKSL